MGLAKQPWFNRISRPSRYLGKEVNAIVKDPGRVEVSVVLAYPDVYEVGMSHVGLKILYHLLNSRPWLAAERAFAPWVDLEREMRARNFPLTSLETERPLASFDMVGFSLQHELSYTNVLNMLDLSGIPILAENRRTGDPLIIAGGPACFNPEPVADIFDLFVLGDGEEVCLEICRVLRKSPPKRAKDRREILTKLYCLRGVYIPAFFTIHQGLQGPVHAIEPHLPDYKKVKKALLPDIESFPFPLQQIVPYTELVHDRLTFEIARGCTRGCRFCQAGMIYRPVRERGLETILQETERALKLTGYDDLSLLSLSSGDYTCIEALLAALMDRQSLDKVAVSLPSLRVDTLNPDLIKEIKRVRKTGFTLAPEAGNERLRRVINKGLTHAEILDTARAIYEAGWNLIKLYFMVGLPTEDEGDLRDIIELARQLADLAKKGGKKAKLNLSVSTFVPKSHTPFMWASQITLEESRRRIDRIRQGLKKSRVRVKWNQPELSWLEGVFSRGDRRLNGAVLEAWRLGARFDAWAEHFRRDIWEQAFSRSGIDPHDYLHRQRPLDERMPWDHLDSGVNKAFLKQEWQKAHQERPTPDCRKACLECGVCDHKTVDPVLAEAHPPMKKAPSARPSFKGRPTDYRLTFTKLGRAKYLSHLELVRLFIRAFRRAGLNLVHSKGFHPMPRVSFACALPVGTESISETVDIQMAGFQGSSGLKEQINKQLPSGISVIRIEEIPPRKRKERIKESHFLITLNGLKVKEEAVALFRKSTSFPVIKENRKGRRELNARPLVKSLELVSPKKIRLALRHTSGPHLKPVQIIKEVFSLDDHQLHSLRILKTDQVLAPPIPGSGGQPQSQ